MSASLARGLVAALVLVAGTAQAAAARQPAATQGSPQGERIYREGVLPDGSALHGQRKDAVDVDGRDAACATCHGRSGMGVVEGRVVIPPITAPALFRPGEHEEAAVQEHHHLPTPPDRTAYDDATLARAIREGVGADGRALGRLMPRFALDDAAMQALIAHLHHLSAGRTPGAVNDELNFATIITPDADPVARDAMLEVLREFFAMKDDFTHDAKAAQAQGSPAHGYRMPRRWRLHVWQLSGAPDTWERQLDERLRTEPVFAVISGLGGSNWAPVHAFCEHQALPCLFPNTDLPVVAEDDFYPVYFSRGVLLEADLIVTRLAEPDRRPRRVVQVYRADGIGAGAAQALRRALAPTAVAVVDRMVKADDDAAALARALTPAQAGDAIVLWLRPDDLARLPPSAPAHAVAFVSGLMGGLETAPLPAAWRERTLMTYPYALPEERRVLLNYALGWFRGRHIRVVDERVQVDTYIACSLLAENLISTRGTFLRDFLVERVEAMAGTGMFNGNFKRMGLAPGQRFASKGGYLVRLPPATGGAVAADGDWIVP